MLESRNLSLGPTTYLESSEKAGTVIWQSIAAGTTVSEHTKVYLQVSTGPAETPAPTPSPTPTPRPASGSDLG